MMHTVQRKKYTGLTGNNGATFYRQLDHQLRRMMYRHMLMTVPKTLATCATRPTALSRESMMTLWVQK